MSLLLHPSASLISKMEVLPPDVVVYALDTMSHGHPLIHTSTPSSSNSPEFYAFQKLLRHLYRSPDLSLRNVQRLRGHLHRLYTLQRTDGAQLTLKCAPSRDTRLLRHEERGLETEAKILHMIRTSTQVPVPQRVSCDLSTANSLSTAYLLRSHIHGTSLTDLSTYLSQSERAGVDRSLGSHLRALCQLQLESFGMTHRVAAGRGHATWAQAFGELLEAILRDCEDALISLPYEIIRYYAEKHKHYLDDIREPCLIPLDVGGARSVLLDDGSKQIVGLLGFSNVAWGDPMLADVFSDPSEAFWEGFGGRPTNDAGYRVRRLLYYTYRSVVALATHYYRPQQNAGESDARRVMTWAITQLGAT
ncbi:hypothetical protein EG328_000170 [Venturia inaequalis]|uniref:Aminoglycoside phosphotransferase domain-containing protein n=2 Tax=Venturia inaequalis TaxID=5025 RepID=A0A8H3VFP1_VENIN|nr:hypothetical protein EG328_000170 [Venturia inaequalis]